MKQFLRKRYLFLLCILAVAASALTGCKNEEGEIQKIKELDFTVVEEAGLPEELLKMINEKKSQPFKFSYGDDEYLYIARGYGSQKSGGYSVAVQELFLADNAIYFNTELIGPSKQDLVSQTITYPYIVVKIEFIDKSVVFE